MSWAVGADLEHDRFRGYGVPAWCDAYHSKGCREEIDRGFGFLCEHVEYDAAGDEAGGCGPLDELERPTIFVCGEHDCLDVDETRMPPEHPEWVEHLLTDESWEQWRSDNPEKIAALKREADQ